MPIGQTMWNIAMITSHSCVLLGSYSNMYWDIVEFRQSNREGFGYGHIFSIVKWQKYKSTVAL